MDEVNVVLVASETLSQRNQGATIGEMVGRWRQIVAEANGAVPLSVAIAAAFGCPCEGEVDPELVARLAGEAYDGGAVEISLADSIGVGVPAQVRDLPASRCARTSTTPGTPATPTLSPRPRPGSKRSMPALVDTAAARPGARRVGADRRQPRHDLSAAYRGNGPARACREPEVRHP
ncbi:MULTISPECIES: hypothetical protein [Streptomyces]|uniref:hypothetical protein n=1 Tax=Streptomyces TaxID=1883 RepID=UPI002E36C5C4|nr:hypothetical protein [Streptomyces canus]